jgi:hypothetical protein
MVMSLRSKWAASKVVRAGPAFRGRISKLIRNRSGAAGQPPAHFQRNPPGRGQLLFFRPAAAGLARPV